jgi:hypothetical protein
MQSLPQERGAHNPEAPGQLLAPLRRNRRSSDPLRKIEERALIICRPGVIRTSRCEMVKPDTEQTLILARQRVTHCLIQTECLLPRPIPGLTADRLVLAGWRLGGQMVGATPSRSSAWAAVDPVWQCVALSSGERVLADRASERKAGATCGDGQCEDDLKRRGHGRGSPVGICGVAVDVSPQGGHQHANRACGGLRHVQRRHLLLLRRRDCGRDRRASTRQRPPP